MGFIFHYTFRHFFFPVFCLECSFRFPHQQTERHSVLPDSQTSSFLLPFLISICYFVMFMVFKVMPHGFASKPCSQTHEFAF